MSLTALEVKNKNGSFPSFDPGKTFSFFPVPAFDLDFLKVGFEGDGGIVVNSGEVDGEEVSIPCFTWRVVRASIRLLTVLVRSIVSYKAVGVSSARSNSYEMTHQ